MNNPITVEEVEMMPGCPAYKWTYQACEAFFIFGDDWVTLQYISTDERVRGLGFATILLLVAKHYYEGKGKTFGGTVALNPQMKRIYQKLGIKEYDDEYVESEREKSLDNMSTGENNEN